MRLIVLGTVIDTDDMKHTLDRLVELVVDGRENQRSHQIVTVNADFLVHASRDPQMQEVILSASHSTADGMPLVWGSRLMGVPVPERVTGADMVPEFAPVAAKQGLSLYFLGAAEGVAQGAADILVRENPELKIVGVDAPTIEEVSRQDPAILQRIHAANPDVLFVAFGSPRQEKWINENLGQLNVPVSVGIGGTFDFITGRTTRAPMWIRRLGLEWAHRLFSEPRRLWRRYWKDITYFPGAFLRQWRAVRYRGAAELDITVARSGTGDVFGLRGVLVSQSSDKFRQAVATADLSSAIVIDAQGLAHIDSVGLAALVDGAVAARKSGGSLILQNASNQVLAAIEATSLTHFFEVHATPAEVEQSQSVAAGLGR